MIPLADRTPPLDVTSAAAHLGTTVSHVRRLVLERRIPFLKVGAKVRFLVADLDDWLLAQRVEPVNNTATWNALTRREPGLAPRLAAHPTPTSKRAVRHG